MKITETTHHGSFRQTRTVEVPALTAEGFAPVLETTPYQLSRADAGELAASLAATGRAEWGWTTWTVD